ncbi:MAG: site-2 protease family protein [Planctomycetota bacterium]
MGFELFITNLFGDADQRFFFFCVVITVIVSIVLHELAHGWAAIRLGDDTPIRLDRMTGNPLVHMGPYSLLGLAVFGIAWGQMPVDPTRMRGRYCDAQVAVAGPAMNVLLAIVTLTSLALWIRFGGFATGPGVAENGQTFLRIAGIYNLVLAAFNLLPAPPLDGSRILGDFVEKYRRFAFDPANQGAMLLAFFFAFAVAGRILVPWCRDLADHYVLFVLTVGA